MHALPLLFEYVETHNRGVETGIFEPMLDLFHPLARMEFEGIDFGPLQGAEAIGEAFRSVPPTDRLELIRVSNEGERASAIYAWGRTPGVVSGTLDVSEREGMIDRLRVEVIAPVEV